MPLLWPPASPTPPGADRVGGAEMDEDDSWWRPLLLVLVVVAAVSGFQWMRSGERRALEALSEPERRERYLQTRRDAEAFCVRRELRTQCRAKLELLLLFPECDEACQAFVARRRAWRP
ncbi:MAG TPA: hypothetical protein VMT11_12545 [Myxococcaceae bacterium]|nr:hypothetical protein [Myxococcaceae bacterium]